MILPVYVETPLRFTLETALVKGEVLNIPRIDSSLDGLFSAGLRFIQGKFVFY